MTSIRCPICKAAVSGDGELALTHSLRDHLADSHGIRDLCEMGQKTMPLGQDIGEGPQDRGPEEMANIKRGAVPPEMMEGEDIEESVQCPFCGARVFGHDGDDLSNQLHDHIEGVHELRPAHLTSRLKY